MRSLIDALRSTRYGLKSPAYGQMEKSVILRHRRIDLLGCARTELIVSTRLAKEMG